MVNHSDPFQLAAALQRAQPLFFQKGNDILRQSISKYVPDNHLSPRYIHKGWRAAVISAV
jgi:hypothetical protein